MIRNSPVWELESQACGQAQRAFYPQCQVRFQGEADRNRQAKPVGSVENGPISTVFEADFVLERLDETFDELNLPTPRLIYEQIWNDEVASTPISACVRRIKPATSLQFPFVASRGCRSIGDSRFRVAGEEPAVGNQSY